MSIITKSARMCKYHLICNDGRRYKMSPRDKKTGRVSKHLLRWRYEVLKGFVSLAKMRLSMAKKESSGKSQLWSASEQFHTYRIPKDDQLVVSMISRPDRSNESSKQAAFKPSSAAKAMIKTEKEEEKKKKLQKQKLLLWQIPRCGWQTKNSPLARMDRPRMYFSRNGGKLQKCGWFVTNHGRNMRKSDSLEFKTTVARDKHDVDRPEDMKRSAERKGKEDKEKEGQRGQEHRLTNSEEVKSGVSMIGKQGACAHVVSHLDNVYHKRHSFVCLKCFPTANRDCTQEEKKKKNSNNNKKKKDDKERGKKTIKGRSELPSGQRQQNNRNNKGSKRTYVSRSSLGRSVSDKHKCENENEKENQGKHELNSVWPNNQRSEEITVHPFACASSGDETQEKSRDEEQHGQAMANLDANGYAADRDRESSPDFDPGEDANSPFLPTTPGRFHCDVFPFNQYEANSECDSEYWRGGNDDWHFHGEQQDLIHGQGGGEISDVEMWMLENEPTSSNSINEDDAEFIQTENANASNEINNTCSAYL
ncbi:hypothetical protein RFI_27060 [Reticulomyxa filosa]|uniref:Uncharacterized protein n=1 Tax=Reticulomyxa filosa TaxID=46433 RepID=X6MBA7_RETFI|nr:hypothetical protein RFI_27060 [Reticulomyxa filosa]|eukprot:ETO10315.1 hypothetical protein RFI_27060 [Reticulomyxa filosa]